MCSILVVDDEYNNFYVIETLLKNQSYQLHYAASGQEAIAMLELCNPDLILLDVMMPGIDGIEICRQIKSLSKWQIIPIIMITSLNSKSDLAYCLNAGADDFISKPVNGIELRARIHSMLRIKHQYDDLQSLLKLREDMVDMLVHDLRNPLSAILVGLQLLKTPNYPIERQKKQLTQIYSSAQNLQSLIDNLLQISLLESGQIRLNYKEVDIGELIQDALANFEVIAAQKNQSLGCELPTASSRKVFVDRTMIHRTLDNLIANAIKFSPSNSQIMIKLEFLESGDTKIQVIDSGPGVSEELKRNIFDKYEIGTLMPEISQIGLGLAFCKMVVEAHNGKISVQNNYPKGAIFEITLVTQDQLLI